MKRAISSCEPYTRGLLRMILAFTFSLHGYRHLFGLFHVSGGRRAAIPMALDGLPSAFGSLEIAGGLLLFAGLFTRPTAVVLCIELLVAYLFSAAPHGLWPIRNGGNEVLLYFLAFLYFANAGGGAWTLDGLLGKRPGKDRGGIPAGAPLRTD
jgi:putative oxidoreductase